MMRTQRSWRVYPSLLSANPLKLGEEIQAIEKTCAHGIHLDVMDGHFVPPITFGSALVAAIRQITPLFLDVHLMVQNPLQHLARFIEAGADAITLPIEAVQNQDIGLFVQQMHAAHKKAGLALNPSTPIASLLPYREAIDHILIMGVPSGYGGQPFQPHVLETIQTLRALAPDLCLLVDGGVNTQTVHRIRDAGASGVIAGHAVFRSPCYQEAIQALCF